jgi:dTDP-glucose 4,6-dehydratase
MSGSGPLGAPPGRDLDLAVEAVGERWGALDGMDLFFTGGTGFVGAWMNAVLLRAVDRGRLVARVRLLTRAPRQVREARPWLANHPAVTLVEGDVLDGAWTCQGCTHLVAGATAASAALLGSDPARMFRTIVDGTRITLDRAREAGVRRALFLSSGAANGPQPAEVAAVAEDRFFGPDPLRTGSAYAEGKRAAEHLFALEGLQGLSFSVARLWAFVGPLLPLDQHFAVGNFLGDVLAGRAVRILGDGTTVRSYQYAGEMAAWCWSVLAAGGEGRAYNVGSPEAVSMRELAGRCAELGEGAGFEVLGKGDPARPRDVYVPDLERARTELGLVPAVPLGEALRRTLAWHRQGGG